MFGLTTRAVNTNSHLYKHQPHQYATTAARAKNQVATKGDDGEKLRRDMAKKAAEIDGKIAKYYDEFGDCEEPPLDPCQEEA